jgi:hypothetical protein
LGPTELVAPEDGDRMKSPGYCVLNKNRTMFNIQKYKSSFLLANCLFDLLFYPEDGGKTFLRNVGKYLFDHTVIYVRGECSFFG